MAKKSGSSPAARQAKAAARRAEARRKARSARVRNIGIVAVGAALAVGLVLAAAGNAPSGNTSPTAWDLPAMGPTAETQDRLALADFAGKPTVVNFFASWCIECDRELPGFRTVSTEFADQINFVGIASQETGNAMFMPERHEVTFWPLARDVGGARASGLSEALGARGMPLTAFYDENGELLTVQLGAMAEPTLRAALLQLYGIGA